MIGVRDESSQFKRAEKLRGVVVPNFEYLKAQHIGNAREWVVWELENLGRELPGTSACMILFCVLSPYRAPPRVSKAVRSKKPARRTGAPQWEETRGKGVSIR